MSKKKEGEQNQGRIYFFRVLPSSLGGWHPVSMRRICSVCSGAWEETVGQRWGSDAANDQLVASYSCFHHPLFPVRADQSFSITRSPLSFLTPSVNLSGSHEFSKTHPILHFSPLPSSGTPDTDSQELTPPHPINRTADTSHLDSSRLSLLLLQSVTYPETGSCQISQATVSPYMKLTDSWLKVNTQVGRCGYRMCPGCRMCLWFVAISMKWQTVIGWVVSVRSQDLSGRPATSDDATYVT